MTQGAMGATPSLSLTFWGVRGSIPVSGADPVRFGGDTICFEVKLDDDCIIVDAGSGLRRLGAPSQTDSVLELREELLQREHASSFCARQDLHLIL